MIPRLCLLMTCLPALAFTPDSSAIEHPAVASMAQDRRLVIEPAELSKLADQVLAMGADRVLPLITEQHGVDQDIPCPHCKGYSLTFDLDRPEQLTCSECGQVVDDQTMPLESTLTGENDLGETVTYRYHQDGYTQYFIPGQIRRRRHERLAEAARALAERYHATGDAAAGELAVRILVRFAEVYPHWPTIENTRPASYKYVYAIDPQRPYDHWGFGRWSRLFMYEIPQDLVFAYDFAYGAQGWTDESRQRVENDLFRPAYRLSWQAHEDNAGHLTNLNPTFYQRAIQLGRVLNDPDMVHYAVHAMVDMGRTYYHFDGMEYEGAMTYHGIVTGRLGIAQRMLSGYSDPDGYIDERFGLTLQNADFNKLFPGMGKAWNVWSEMKFPDGRPVCVHDTNWDSKRRETPADAVAPNIELNAYGHFAIGRGMGPDAMQAHLHFCPRSEGGHFHSDRLAISLWAAGEELLPDVGYVHVGRPHRYFVNRELDHNTVEVLFNDPPEKPEEPELTDLPRDPVARFAVEAQNERPVTDARSSLLAYDPGTVSNQQVQLIAASSPGPAWMNIAARERALLMIAVDDHRSYLVDKFRVAGGNTHQFVLRPSEDEDVTSQISLNLTPQPGTLAGPDGEYGKVAKDVPPYSWLVHDLQAKTTGQPWQLTWTGADSGATLRCWFRGQPGSQVILAQSPTVRRADQDPRKSDDFQGPQLLLRRHGETGFESVFGAVYDAARQGKEPLVQAVEWLEVDGAVALRVTLDGREDLVYLSDDQQPRTVVGVTFQGSCAVVSRTGERPSWAWAHQGAAKVGGLAVDSGPTQRAPLTKILREADGDAVNGFEIAARVGDAEALVGQWLRVILGDGKAFGYRIEAVEAVDRGTRFTIDGDPGLALTPDGSQMLYNPFFETPGRPQVELSRSAFAAAE